MFDRVVAFFFGGGGGENPKLDLDSSLPKGTDGWRLTESLLKFRIMKISPVLSPNELQYQQAHYPVNISAS